LSDGTPSLNFDGKVDEVGIFDKALTSTEISQIYNVQKDGFESGQYPTFEYEEEPLPTVSNLPAQNIDDESALLRAVPSGDLTGWDADFRWRIKGLSTWDNVTSINGTSNIEPINNTIFSYDAENLLYDSNYEYQGYIYNSTTGTYVFGNLTDFNTTKPPVPTVVTDSALNVNSTYALLKGSVYFEWDSVLYYFRWRPSGVNATWNNTPADSMSSPADQTYGLNGLDPQTEYEYQYVILYEDDYSKNETGDIEYFETSDIGAPIISTLPATNIKRTTAQINGNISSLGNYDSIDIYFKIQNTTNIFYTDTIPYTVENIEIGETLTGLAKNESYNFTMFASYNTTDTKTRSGFLKSFKTLSDSDYLPPELQINPILDDDIGFNKTTVSAYVDLYNATDPSFQFRYYTSLTSPIVMNSTELTDINESGYRQDTLEGLEDNTFYTVYAILFYDAENGTRTSVVSDELDFTTKDLTEAPKTVTVVGNFTFFVKDPYFFQMLMIIGVTVVGLGLSVGATFQQGNIERFLVWGILATTLIFIIWGFDQAIISTTQISFTFVSVVAYGIYLGLKTTRGVSYG